MKVGKEIPLDKSLDNTLTLLSEGFNFIPNRREQYQSDIFETRLLGQKAICFSGEEAAKAFYDEERFIRKGAIPKRIEKSLFGEKGVQTLDGAEHKQRKGMFMSIMTHENLDRLVSITEANWKAIVPKWQKKKEINLFQEATEVLFRVACDWAGVPYKERKVSGMAKDLAEMVDAFGGVGPRYQRGKFARKRMEKWVGDIINQVRTGKLTPPEYSAAYKISHHRDLDGELLDEKVAAVELLNIIRPIVAISIYIVFGAVALYQFPKTRAKIKTGDQEYLKMFVQEVRRFYPFGPFLGARVRKDFLWEGYLFKKGTLVILDLYGTNHHPDLWNQPDNFLPERFKDWKGSPFNFIPQGGGDYDTGHRCAGEWVTVKVMQTTMDFLVNQIKYDVPDQDLSYSTVRMPTMPESGFNMTNVKGI